MLLWQLHATCSSATYLLFLEYVKNLRQRRNQLYTPALIEQILFANWGIYRELQVGLELDFPASPGDCFANWEALQTQKYFFTCSFLQNTYWLFLSVRGQAFQTSAHFPVRYWPDILHDRNGLWAIMELLLYILAKLFTNSSCMVSWKIVLLLFWRRCKNVKWTLSIFVLLIMYSSSKTCAVLYHGNLSFQINKFRVEYNACCPESSCQATFLNIMCQKDFEVWFFRKHPPALSNQYLPCCTVDGWQEEPSLNTDNQPGIIVSFFKVSFWCKITLSISDSA